VPVCSPARGLGGLLCGLGLLLALLAGPASATLLEGRVINVADGDTLTVLDDRHQSHKVRLAGIDAPERGQPFGGRAKDALTTLTKQQRVSVEGGKTDRYRRRIGIVRVAPTECPACAPSIDVGLALIGTGMAWHYRAYEREQPVAERERYRMAESGARTAQLGLWADAAPTPPWDWRRVRRAGGSHATDTRR